jgi:spermidine synthase
VTATALVERVETSNGEIALRRAGDDFEIISNGVFLMDSRGGASERLLVGAALDAVQPGAHLVIGGLGIGFSLQEAVASWVPGAITVVEREPVIVSWHATHLRRYTAEAMADPRVEVVTADIVDWLRDTQRQVDAICLDIDNGPEWTVTDGNGFLYSADGLTLLCDRLRPGGVLAVWSASASPAFAERLRVVFRDVHEHEVPVPRGEPDVVYLARR